MNVERRVAQRYAAKRRHYRFSKRKLKSLNDPARRQDTMREDGGYSVHKIVIVPIKDIRVPKVWNPTRFTKSLARMRKDQALDPIRADKLGGKWEISDGIHRTNASIEMGYTHIPILTSDWVETPEAFVPEPAEKRQLNLGDWVKAVEPHRWEGKTREYGWVDEKLGPRTWRGVKRYWYSIALVGSGEDWPDFVDMSDTEFEPVRAPLWGADAQKAYKAKHP